MRLLLSESATSGPVVTCLVVFAVILLGPVVMQRLGPPGLIGLVLGDDPAFTALPAAVPVLVVDGDSAAAPGDRLAAHQ